MKLFFYVRAWIGCRKSSSTSVMERLPPYIDLHAIFTGIILFGGRSNIRWKGPRLNDYCLFFFAFYEQ